MHEEDNQPCGNLEPEVCGKFWLWALFSDVALRASMTCFIVLRAFFCDIEDALIF